MNLLLLMKYYAKKSLTVETRLYLRKLLRKATTMTQQKMKLEEFIGVLQYDLGIKEGDTVLFSSSFGRLNANFSPQYAIDALKELITRRGNIIMPFYPPGLTYEWLESGKVFDMRTTRSYTGILTQVLSESEGVLKSKHPIKAVVAWGKDADYIVKGHELTITPFDESSPYKKILDIAGSKSVGIGLLRVPIFHVTEDLSQGGHNSYYSGKIYEARCRDYDGTEFIVRTRSHGDLINEIMMPIAEYIHKIKTPSLKRVAFKRATFFAVNNRAMFDHVQRHYDHGINRITIKQIKNLKIHRDPVEFDSKAENSDIR